MKIYDLVIGYWNQNTSGLSIKTLLNTQNSLGVGPSHPIFIDSVPLKASHYINLELTSKLNCCFLNLFLKLENKEVNLRFIDFFLNFWLYYRFLFNFILYKIQIKKKLKKKKHEQIKQLRVQRVYA